MILLINQQIWSVLLLLNIHHTESGQEPTSNKKNITKQKDKVWERAIAFGSYIKCELQKDRTVPKVIKFPIKIAWNLREKGTGPKNKTVKTWSTLNTISQSTFQENLQTITNTYRKHLQVEVTTANSILLNVSNKCAVQLKVWLMNNK